MALERFAPAQDRFSEAADWFVREKDGCIDGEAFGQWLDRDPKNGAAWAKASDAWDAFEPHLVEPEVILLRLKLLAKVRGLVLRRRSAMKYRMRRGFEAFARIADFFANQFTPPQKLKTVRRWTLSGK